MATVIYARQSLDRDGSALAVGRQLALCRQLCDEQGWTVSAELVDNDLSATSGVRRPSFEQLIAANPERIVVWHIDRLVRLTKDLEMVIALGADVHAVRAGHIDLSNPAGRAVARTVTAWATYEGEQKAERQRAANDQRAAAGRPPAGRRCYGYTSDGLAIVESEAVHVRSAAANIIAGESLRSVARTMNGSGCKTTAGNPWQPTELRRYLARPRLAGLRVHRGLVVGPGVWPALIDMDDHTVVKTILTDPSRRRKGRPRTNLLSGVARCGVCGGRLYGRIERRGPIYVCESGAHLGRKSLDIDAHVSSVVVARMSLPDAAVALARPGDERQLERAREERSLTLPLDGLAEAFATGEIDRRQLAAGTSRLRVRVSELEAEGPQHHGTAPYASLIATGDVTGTWRALPVSAQRDVIDVLMHITVKPAGRGARSFDPDTIEIGWRQ